TFIPLLYLNIPPIRQLQHQRTILHKTSGDVVIGIDDEEVGGGTVPPLEAGVEVKIILLLIVLGEGCEEQFVGHGHVYPRPYKPKVNALHGLWKHDVIIGRTHAQPHIRLKTIPHLPVNPKTVAIKIATELYRRPKGKQA